MGLDYSMRFYVKKDKIISCLQWLHKNSYSFGEPCLKISDSIPTVEIIGENFRISHRHNKVVSNVSLNGFDKIYYSTSLIFDIEPRVISTLADWSINHDPNRIDDFIETFTACYLGNGKVRVGSFDTTIYKLKKHDLFKLTFTAVTSDMSEMVRNSLSVRRWALEMSDHSESVLTYLHLESEGKHIIYYKGSKVDILLREPLEQDSGNNMIDFFTDFYNFEDDYERDWL